MGAIIFICDTMIDLIHIAIIFHPDILYSYLVLVLACIRTALEIYQRDINLKHKSWDQYLTTVQVSKESSYDLQRYGSLIIFNQHIQTDKPQVSKSMILTSRSWNQVGVKLDITNT